MIDRIIHVNIPYGILRDQITVVLEKRLNPEIYLNGDTLDRLNPEEVQDLAKTLAENNLSVSIHGPFMDLSPGGVDCRVRKVTEDRFMQALEAASYFNPRALVLHGGYNRWYFNGNTGLWLERSLLTWGATLKRARKLNIPIAVENIFEEEPSTLKKLMTAVNDPLFGICFDPGHFNLFTKVPMSVWLETLGPHILEIHLHDNHAANDDHLPMGEGAIDFAELFDLLKQHSVSPIYTIEPHRVQGVEKSLDACRRYLERMDRPESRGIEPDAG